MLVKGGLRDSDLLRDIAHRRAKIPPFREQLKRRFRDSILCARFHVSPLYEVDRTVTFQEGMQESGETGNLIESVDATSI